MKTHLMNFIPITFSTNRLMMDKIQDNLLSNNKLEEFYTIYAGYQKSGRGLAANRWHSEANQNILASIYFEPPIPPSRQFVFNQCFALAVRRFIAQYGVQVCIKWPNDIYVEGKKIAGILIEHSIVGERIAYTIAGVGININQNHFPPELPNPVSLAQLTGQQYPIDRLLSELLECCASYYELLKNGKSEIINEEYISHVYRMGEWSSYLIFGNQCTAQITGFDAYGRLLLKDMEQNSYCCGLKEVVFL